MSLLLKSLAKIWLFRKSDIAIATFTSDRNHPYVTHSARH